MYDVNEVFTQTFVLLQTIENIMIELSGTSKHEFRILGIWTKIGPMYGAKNAKPIPPIPKTAAKNPRN